MSWLAANWQWLVGIGVLHFGLRSVVRAVVDLRTQAAKDTSELKDLLVRLDERNWGRITERFDGSMFWISARLAVEDALARRDAAIGKPWPAKTEDAPSHPRTE